MVSPEFINVKFSKGTNNFTLTIKQPNKFANPVDPVRFNVNELEERMFEYLIGTRTPSSFVKEEHYYVNECLIVKAFVLYLCTSYAEKNYQKLDEPV